MIYSKMIEAIKKSIPTWDYRTVRIVYHFLAGAGVINGKEGADYDK